MARSQWTLLLVPHENERVRSVRISRSSVQVVLAVLLVVVLLAGTASVGLVSRASQYVRAERLQRENRLLAAEVAQMREQMSLLATSLDSLAARDEMYRTLAGLTPIDADVRRVGIGGPGTPTLEASALYQLNPEAGAEVFAASYDLSALLRRAQLLRSSLDEAIRTMEANVERLDATPSIMPSSGHLSSLFSRNRRHPVLRITRPHQGIDIAAPVGEPIVAPAKGRVVFAGWKSGGYGNTVEIDHGYGYLTRYAHASRLHVRVGQSVERGQVIAEVGATGLVTGPHLHYEVEVNGRPVDPLNFIIEDAVPH
jgi:murein DD-endopeptidase MepM/ murein hydrolase activator NlpD